MIVKCTAYMGFALNPPRVRILRGASWHRAKEPGNCALILEDERTRSATMKSIVISLLDTPGHIILFLLMILYYILKNRKHYVILVRVILFILTLDYCFDAKLIKYYRKKDCCKNNSLHWKFAIFHFCSIFFHC